jgi:hypothetical protein
MPARSVTWFCARECAYAALLIKEARGLRREPPAA